MRRLQLAFAVFAILQLDAAAALGFGASKPKLTVCMDPRNDMEAIMSARNLASRMFTEAGIAIEWRGWNCPAEAIRIKLSYQTPPKLQPEALAYALPRQGHEIVLFYNRMKRTIESYRFSYLLAHVVVHEITHILQGVDRHSEKGLMKAKWDWQDYAQMDGMGLAFTKDDIEWIHRGIERRAETYAQK